MGTEIENIGSTVSRSGSDVEAVIARGKGVKGVLPITARLASELEEPSTHVEDLGRDYAKTLGELDPAINGLLDLIELQSEVDQEHFEFLQQLQGLVEESTYASNGLSGLVETAREMSTLSRALRAPLGRMRGGLQGVLDGRAIIEEWGRRAVDLEARYKSGQKSVVSRASPPFLWSLVAPRGIKPLINAPGDTQRAACSNLGTYSRTLLSPPTCRSL